MNIINTTKIEIGIIFLILLEEIPDILKNTNAIIGAAIIINQKALLPESKTVIQDKNNANMTCNFGKPEDFSPIKK